MKNLKYARVKKDLSQEELGEKLGVVAATISRYETGKAEPSFNILRNMADILEVTVDYLIEDTENK